MSTMNEPPALPHGVSDDGEYIITSAQKIIPETPLPGHEGHWFNLTEDLGSGAWRACCSCGDPKMVGTIRLTEEAAS